MNYWFLFILLFNTVAFAPQIASAAKNPLSSIYHTELPNTLDDALQTIAARTPFWIHLKNESDMKNFFTFLKHKFSKYNQEWLFWEGYLLHAMGKEDQACELIQAMSSPSDYMRKHRDYLLLDIAMYNSDCTLQLTRLTLPNPPNSTLDRQIYERYFLYLLKIQNWELLGATLASQEKNRSLTDHFKVFLKTIHALMDFKSGNESIARKAFIDILTNQAGSFYEIEIFLALEKRGIKAGDFLNSQEWLKRAETLIEKGYPLNAKNIFESLSKITKENYDESIARALFAAKDYNASSRAYEKLLKGRIKSGSQNSEWLTYLAQSYARSNQFDKVIKLYEKTPSTSLKIANPNYKLGFLYFDSGQYAKALDYFNKVRIEPGKNNESLWLKFWSHYFLKNYPEALNLLKLMNTNDPARKNKIIYWQARLNEKMQQKIIANTLYSSLIQSNLPDYYAYISRQRLQTNHLEPLNIIDLKKMPRPLHANFKQTTLNNHSSKSIFDYLNSRILGLNVSDMINTGSSQTAAMYYSGLYNQLTALGTRQLKARPAGFNPEAYFWTYPLAYKEWVYFYSGIYGIDPFLALSIMKQESGFRPNVSSPALALGLMQIIPQTSRDLAREITLYKFHHDDLVLPSVNIRLGNFYLKKRLGEYGPNLPYIIASYNAGENAVNRWKVQGDKMEADEFIEQIPYAETQNYVKKVLTNYWTYLLLYTK